MNQTILIFDDLLKEFGKQPKFIPEPTYLELCRYPTSRFEEICTRLLCFYFDPNNEHCFHDLFLDALLHLISPAKSIPYRTDQIQVVNELYSDGKRLDMLIKSPDMVIGIENKIYASVYNPLDVYSNQIDLYGKKNVFKVILTVRKINSIAERNMILSHGFLIVTYSDLLHRIKITIGNYIARANQKYLVYLYDFIQTIDNMTGETYDDNKLSNFFSNNADKIDNLLGLYAKYNERIRKVQIEAVSELLKRLKERTGDQHWWEWEGWDLGYDAFNKDLSIPRIGIEASYELFHNNPLGLFRIYITTWNIKHFVPYEDRLIELFPEKLLVKTNDNRVYLHIDIVEDNNIEIIIEKLTNYYEVMHTLAKAVSITE
jgi:hypothetical protein